MNAEFTSTALVLVLHVPLSLQMAVCWIWLLREGRTTAQVHTQRSNGTPAVRNQAERGGLHSVLATLQNVCRSTRSLAIERKN